MGVKGLTSFVDENNHLLKDHRLHDTRVVIDGNNLLHFLFWYYNVKFRFGGNLDNYADCVRTYFKTLCRCGVKPYVVYDGAYQPDDRKLMTLQSRAKEKIYKSLGILRSTRSKLIPGFASTVFMNTVAQIGIPHVTCAFEADDQIAALANAWGCPVMSNDSDFFIYDLKGGFVVFDYVNLDVLSSKDWETHSKVGEPRLRLIDRDSDGELNGNCSLSNKDRNSGTEAKEPCAKNTDNLLMRSEKSTDSTDSSFPSKDTNKKTKQPCSEDSDSNSAVLHNTRTVFRGGKEVGLDSTDTGSGLVTGNAEINYETKVRTDTGNAEINNETNVHTKTSDKLFNKNAYINGEVREQIDTACERLSIDGEIKGQSNEPMDTNAEEPYQYLSVQIYHRKNMTEFFPNLTDSMLPLFACLYGNDVVYREYFEEFYNKVDLPLKSKLAGIWSSPRGRFDTILKLLLWLNEAVSREVAMEKVLHLIPNDGKVDVEKVRELMTTSIESYTISDGYLATYFETGEVTWVTQAAPMVGKYLEPGWFHTAVANGEIDRFSLNLHVLKRAILKCILENVRAESAYQCASPILRVLYSVVCGEDHSNVIEFRRVDFNYVHTPVELISEMPLSGRKVPYLREIAQLSYEEKYTFLLETFGIENPAALEIVDRDELLLVISMVHWIKNASVDKVHLSSLVLSALKIAVDLEIEARSGTAEKPGFQGRSQDLVEPRFEERNCQSENGGFAATSTESPRKQEFGSSIENFDEFELGGSSDLKYKLEHGARTFHAEVPKENTEKVELKDVSESLSGLCIEASDGENIGEPVLKVSKVSVEDSGKMTYSESTEKPTLDANEGNTDDLQFETSNDNGELHKFDSSELRKVDNGELCKCDNGCNNTEEGVFQKNVGILSGHKLMEASFKACASDPENKVPSGNTEKPESKHFFHKYLKDIPTTVLKKVQKMFAPLCEEPDRKHVVTADAIHVGAQFETVFFAALELNSILQRVVPSPCPSHLLGGTFMHNLYRESHRRVKRRNYIESLFCKHDKLLGIWEQMVKAVTSVLPDDDRKDFSLDQFNGSKPTKRNRKKKKSPIRVQQDVTSSPSSSNEESDNEEDGLALLAQMAGNRYGIFALNR